MKFLVLDANILIRSVLGSRVSSLITNMSQEVEFFTPDICLEDAQKYLPELMAKKGIPSQNVLKILDEILECVHVISPDVYKKYEKQAKGRIQIRDVDDWPIVACALALNCPIWTEDTDFFGTGIAIWTTDRVQLYITE
jgi:predicted nucleic acid-binding protein